MAKRDAVCTKEQAFLVANFPSLRDIIGTSVVGVNIWLSYKFIDTIFTRREAKIAMEWYDTVYNLRMN